MNNTNYCHGCGRPLEADARFCEACGRPVLQPNTSQTQNASYDHQRYAQTNSQTQPAQTNNQSKSKKSIGTSIIVVFIGLLLLLLALRLPILNLIGTKTLGQVTNIRKVVDSNTSSMDFTYRVSYVFLDDDGKSINSSFDMAKDYDFSKVPREGKMITIRYLPAIPHFNAPTEYNNSGLGSFVMSIIGIGLIVLGATGKVSFSRRKYRK